MAALTSSALCPSMAVTTPPTAYPATCAAWPAMFWNERPTTYLSPVSNCATIAERAAWNGGVRSEAPSSSRSRAGSGMPGMAIMPRISIRATSQMIMTRRYG